MEIQKVAKSDEKSSFSSEKLLFRWQPKKDSNPHKQSQSLSCYLYTIRLLICAAVPCDFYSISQKKYKVKRFFQILLDSKRVILKLPRERKLNG